MLLKSVSARCPICVFDNAEKREYILAVFCKTSEKTEKELCGKITALLEDLPKNALTSRSSSPEYQRMVFNAALLYQENRVFLENFIKNLVRIADLMELDAAEINENVIFPKAEADPKKPKRSKKRISKSFDRYSVKGLIFAAVGAFSAAVICGLVAYRSESSAGEMLASWSLGALCGLMTIGGYRLFAGKTDIFGAVSCTVLTAASCFAGAAFHTQRKLMLTARCLDASISVDTIRRNATMYNLMFPKVWGGFTFTLTKFLFSAAAALTVFFILYFRKHSDIMYSSGEYIITDKKENEKNISSDRK